MAGLREQKKLKTRRAITASAVKLFSAKGYDNTSIEDIARDANIGKATVYTYFSNKNEIFRFYCNQELEESFTCFQKQQKDGACLTEQMTEFFLLKFKFITRDPEFGRQLLREMLFPVDVNDKCQEHDQRYFEILEILFRSAQDRGEIPADVDMFYLTVHFYSLYIGILSGWYTGYLKTDAEVEASMRVLFSQAIEGIAA